MSFWSKLFGPGKGRKDPTPQEAIQRIQEAEEILNKKTALLEEKIEQELRIAKKHGKTNKRIALQALKRKKRYEAQLAQIDGTLSTLEFQRDALENTSTNVEVLSVLGVAAKALKESHKHMDIDKVNDLMDDIHEQQDLSKEISELISNPYGFGADGIDEDDLLKELEDMEQEALDEQLLEIGGQQPGKVELPGVPSSLPSDSLPASSKGKTATEDDADLLELASWAS